MADKQSELRIALLGYGVMGKLLERLAPEHDCRVTEVFDENNLLKDYHPDISANFDVAIDFSLPRAVRTNVEEMMRLGLPVVIGTTGWEEDMPEVRTMVQRSGIGCLYGSNFSIGMNMFFEVVRQAGKILNQHSKYDVMLHELHHSRKADSPSGTALELANIVLNTVERKQSILRDRSDGPIAPEQLHVSSTRGGDIPGTHTVIIDSAADSIRLTHAARNREGFAHGALRAARWLNGKTGLYDFSQIFAQL